MLRYQNIVKRKYQIFKGVLFMKKLFVLFGLFLFTILLPTYVVALTVIPEPVSQRADWVSEQVYVGAGNPLHTGDLIEVFDDNNSPNVLSDIAGWLITNNYYSSGFTLTESDSFDADLGEISATAWGTTTFIPAVSLYAVKAGSAFALYQIATPTSIINWNTWELWIRGINGNGATLEISHLTGYNPSPVPEPATMALFGLGLLGIAGLGRKTRKK